MAWDFSDSSIYQIDTSGMIQKSVVIIDPDLGYQRKVITPDSFVDLDPVTKLSQIRGSFFAASNGKDTIFLF